MRNKVRVRISIADISVELDLLILLEQLIRLDRSSLRCEDTPSRCGVLIARAGAMIISVRMVSRTVTVVVVVVAAAIAIFEGVRAEYFTICSARVGVRAHLF